MTREDIVYSVLFSCVDEPIKIHRLVGYMYFYQYIGMEFSYKYIVTPTGIKCKALDVVLNECIKAELIEIKNNMIHLTDRGIEEYSTYGLSEYDYQRLLKLNDILSEFSSEELSFICITCIFLEDMLAKYGVTALMERKDVITRSLSGISNLYSEENFQTACRVINKIKDLKEGRV